VRPSRVADLPKLEALEEYFDLFTGATGAAAIAVKDAKLSSGLQKTYLLETVGDLVGLGDLSGIFARSSLRAEPIGDGLSGFALFSAAGIRCAIVEKIAPRYLALYTLLPSQESDKLVKTAVAANPYLDHLWLSSQSFRALWNHVRETNSGRRYGKITFEHESIFQIDVNIAAEDSFEDERRASRFTMVDRLDVIEQQLAPLQESYAPLASITHLRIPAAGRGGHDLYVDGKVTNRSDSFLDHRSALLDIVRMYSGLTSNLESQLWVRGQEAEEYGGLSGAVAELVFSSPLSQPTFNRWMLSLWNNRRNRFRLAGYPTWSGPNRVQASVIDQHLWQPLVMEFTTSRIFAIIPEGTCGNTINRLVSNVQRFIDPQVEAFVGGVSYASLIPALSGEQVG
jgi:hypothetical protein